MMKSKRRRAKRRRSRRQRKRERNLETVYGLAPHADQVAVTKSKVLGGHEETGESSLTTVVRTVGIAPIALLVSFLASHDLYPALVPHWFQPIVEKQTAVLTLSAGYAGIIGLLISIRGRFGWSTYSLFIAAAATATAGFRTIGDSMTGQIVATLLALLIFPAVWPGWFSAKLRPAWRYIWSRKGFTAFLFVSTILSMAYNLSQNENYIRDLMLIPLGILLGIFAASYLVWRLIQKSVRYIPFLYNLLSSPVRSVYRWAMRRRDASEQCPR